MPPRSLKSSGSAAKLKRTRSGSASRRIITAGGSTSKPPMIGKSPAKPDIQANRKYNSFLFPKSILLTKFGFLPYYRAYGETGNVLDNSKFKERQLVLARQSQTFGKLKRVNGRQLQDELLCAA